MNLAKEVYRLTDLLPRQEMFGLSSQMRRSAVSIPSNIAEGQQRNNLKEYIQFLGIAYGSAAELETQLLLASDLFGPKENYAVAIASVIEIQKILNAVLRTMKEKNKTVT